MTLPVNLQCHAGDTAPCCPSWPVNVNYPWWLPLQQLAAVPQATPSTCVAMLVLLPLAASWFITPGTIVNWGQQYCKSTTVHWVQHCQLNLHDGTAPHDQSIFTTPDAKAQWAATAAAMPLPLITVHDKCQLVLPCWCCFLLLRQPVKFYYV